MCCVCESCLGQTFGMGRGGDGGDDQREKEGLAFFSHGYGGKKERSQGRVAVIGWLMLRAQMPAVCRYDI